MTTPYVREDEIRAHLSKEKVNHDDQIARVAIAAASYTDTFCGRGFRLYSGETREFVIGRHGRIEFVDLVSDNPTISVDVDCDMTFSEDVTAGSYRLMPRNEDDGSTAVRYQWLEPWPHGVDAYLLQEGYLVQIEGDWGYVEGELEEAPDGVKFANLLMIARWYKRRETVLSVAQMPGIGFKRVFEMDKDALDILEQYVHPRKRRIVQ